MQKLREWVDTKPQPATPLPPGPAPIAPASVRDEHLAHAAGDLKHAASDIKEGVKGGARNLRDEVRDEARQAKGAVLDTVGRVAAVASSEMDRLRSKAELEAEYARKQVHSAKESLKDKEERLERRIKQATATKIFLDKRAPYYRDVCADYDVTFSQPSLSSKRLVLSTPDLMMDSDNCSMIVSTVHDSSSGNEQLAATFDWEDTFGSTKVLSTGARPLLTRPQNVALSTYLALPTAAAGKPVLRLGMDVTDELSDYSVGGFFKQSGVQWLAGYKSRMPYLTLAGYVKSDAKIANRYMMSTAFASTLFRDTARGSSLTGGLQVDSTPFSSKADSSVMMPDAVGSVTAKAEYDEPSFNLDMKVRASMYTNTQNNSQGFKISDAFLRGMYVFNAGQYPRSVVGATVGVVDGGAIGERDALNVSGSVDESASGLDSASASPRSFRPYGDPDAVVASSTLQRLFGSNGGNGSLAVLNKPVAQVHWYHALNPRNKVKVSLSSDRALHSSFTYQLLQNVSISTSLQSVFPRSWNVVDSVGKGGVKNSMGIAISIGAV